MTSHDRIKHNLKKHYDVSETGCWLWHGATINGYGSMFVGGKNGKTELAHRMSYLVHKGWIPGDRCVLHRCDTPRCVNPDHLFPGTRLDNSRDMDAKGRRASFPGELHPRAKLTLEQVHEIRSSSDSNPVIAARYGLTREYVWRLRQGQTWKEQVK